MDILPLFPIELIQKLEWEALFESDKGFKQMQLIMFKGERNHSLDGQMSILLPKYNLRDLSSLLDWWTKNLSVLAKAGLVEGLAAWHVPPRNQMTAKSWALTECLAQVLEPAAKDICERLLSQVSMRWHTGLKNSKRRGGFESSKKNSEQHP